MFLPSSITLIGSSHSLMVYARILKFHTWVPYEEYKYNFGGMSLLYKIAQKVFERRLEGFNILADTEAEE